MAIGRRGDTFAIWPLVLACSFPALLILVWAGPFGLAVAGAPVVLGFWACGALFALLAAISSGIEHRWRRATSMLVLPTASLVAVLNAGPSWDLAIETGERIHFQLMRASYLREVAQRPADGEPGFAIWNWGGFVIGHAVIYDESDEIVLPKEQQTPEWKERVAGTEVACGVSGTRLGDHFYLVRTGC